MGVSWLAVLQSVPWSDVIRNAPKVAEGAKNLFDTVAGRKRGADPEATPATAAGTGATETASPEARAIAALDARLATLEAGLAEQNAQLLASSQLIKDLAEQNAQLIRGIEANRLRLRWLSGVAGLALLLACAALVILLRA